MNKTNGKYRNVFYVIQVHPSIPGELKLSRSRDLSKRLRPYKTLCPRLKLLRLYRVQPQAEKPAIAFLFSLPGSQRISAEVVQVADTTDFLVQCDNYFGKKRKTTV